MQSKEIFEKKYIGINSTVTFYDKELDETEVYTIVQGNAKNSNELSDTSLLGKSLCGKCVGDEVFIKAERPYKVEVIDIKNPVGKQRPLSESEKRQKILETRKIKYLVHFTRLENLQSILLRGIWPRKSIEKYAQNFTCTINDDVRLDNKQHCVSLSVSSSNYKMLYSLKEQIPNSRWAILVIDASILCDEERSLFCCPCNASTKFGQGIAWGAKSLETIFYDYNQGTDSFRKQLNLHDWEPTNPQAEILLSGIIESKHIMKVIFETHDDVNWFITNYGEHRIKSFKVEIDEDNESGNKWFEPRHDYKYWLKEKTNKYTDNALVKPADEIVLLNNNYNKQGLEEGMEGIVLENRIKESNVVLAGFDRLNVDEFFVIEIKKEDFQVKSLFKQRIK